MNSIGSISSRVSQYLDKFLQMSVANTRAYLKNTKNFLKLLKDIRIPDQAEMFLVTVDVSSLYTVIQHDNALLAPNWAFSQRDDLPHVQKKFLEMTLEFCLSDNYFWYDGSFFTQ